jgi:uracil-DNA glycosylase
MTGLEMRERTAGEQAQARYLPESWHAALGAETAQPYFEELRRFLVAERRAHTVYPPRGEVFSALALTPFEDVRVLILGQDPYHGPGQAHGLAFSVQPGVPAPPSLANIYRELHDDLGCPVPDNGYLAPWARQGVLLLNAVLTVRAGAPASHKDHGWETFTDAVIRALSARERPVVFVLWGGYAGRKAALVDATRHAILRAPHPSPLSAHNGFFGSRPFSRINKLLRSTGSPEIDWCIANL